MHRAPHPLDARRHTGTFTLVRSMMLGVFIAGCRHHKTPTVPKWAIVVSKSNLDFSATAGGQLPAAQTFDVSGGAVSVSSDRAWLTVTPTVVSSATTVTVSVNTAGMSAGSSTGTITVSASSSNASNSPQRITVSLLLTPGPKIAVAPDNLGFDAVVGQPNTVVDSFHITNSGGGTLSNLRAIGTFPWLTATMNGASAPATVTVRVTPGALARGTYRDTIVVTSTVDGVSNSPLKVPVRFTISNPPAIGYTPNTAVKFAKA